MATPKSRLGRGLDSLISGSIVSSPKASRPLAPTPAPTLPKKKKKGKAEKKKDSARPSSAQLTDVPEGTIPLPASTLPADSIPPASGSTESFGLIEVPIGKISPSPHQPRRSFDESSLAELAESIRSEGLLQPVVVRPSGDGAYQLIAGERRWRACQILKLKRIPARVIEASESSSAVMALIENLQRENLNPIDEALGYASLIADFNLTQEAVSERVGKARASVANSLRLLQLDREIQQFIGKRLLSVGHAKVLLGLESTDEQLLLARQVIERQLSVRETEKLVQSKRKANALVTPIAPRSAPPAEQAALADLERRLASSLSTRVELRHSARKGKILIEYYGNEDLQRILERLGVPG